MRATVMYRAGDVRIENVPDARLKEPTDALISISRACICGSDLWPYQALEPQEKGRRMGHEAIGMIEAVGPAVRRLKVGDLVVMPFAYSERQLRVLPRWAEYLLCPGRLLWHRCPSRWSASRSATHSPGRRNPLRAAGP